MKYIFYSLITLLLITYNSFTQNQIDSLDVLSFFPLHVGDKWQYIITNTWYPNDTSYITYTVKDDTIMPNNKYYFELDCGSFPDYIRVDCSDLKVYRYEPIPPDSEYVYYELLRPDTVIIPSYFYFYDTTFGQVGNLPFYRKQNIYWWTDYVIDQERYLSQDFGLSSIITNEGYGYVEYYNLIAAQIDTSIYGQFITSIEHDENVTGFVLYQNYPNPFNQTTKIKFSLDKIENIKIEVYNTLGQKIEILLKEQLPAGLHEIEFNADKLASGVYLYRIEAGDYQHIRKMILLK